MKKIILLLAVGVMILFSVSVSQAASYKIFSEAQRVDPAVADAAGRLLSKYEHLYAQGKYNADIGKDISQGATLTLELFAEPVKYTIKRVTRKKEGKVTYSGSAKIGRSLTIAEHDGRIVGSLHHDGTLYKLRPGENGETLVIEVKQEGLIDHDESYTENDVVFDSTQLVAAANNAADSSSEFTVIVAYTSEFASDAGDVVAYMDLLEEETNTSYANSQINTSVRIVHYYQTAYVETGSFASDLSYFANTSNPRAAELHDLRDQYRADVMVLLTGNSLYGSICGQALNIGVSAENALAAAREGCATGYYSFGHEIGHLFGARHIITQDPATTPYAYGHGYCNVTPYTWRTVMAYNCPTGTGGNRIQYWSNPYVSINGEPTGTVDLEYNAQVMNVRAATVANFRTESESNGVVIAPLLMLLLNN